MENIINTIIVFLLLGQIHASEPTTRFPKPTQRIQYEPPINIVFIIHVEPMPDTTNYETRIAFLEWLQTQALARPKHFKMTLLMDGDFAEFVVHRNAPTPLTLDVCAMLGII